jgi:hypothetical protein
VKAASRRFVPSAFALEYRCTPSVASVTAVGLTPGPGGPGHVSIEGLIGESSNAAGASLSVSYEVTDSHGDVLASGPLTVQPVFPNFDIFAGGVVIALSLPRGSTETISVSATDADSQVPLTATASLYVSPKVGITTLGLGITASNGDTYAGSGQGHVALTQTPHGGFLAKGVASVHIASSPHNAYQLNASLTGAFVLGIGPAGNVGLSLSHGTAVFNYGTFAGDTAAGSGVSATMSGNLNIGLNAHTSTVTPHATGSIKFAAQIKSTSTTNSAPSTFTGTAHNIALGVQIDSAGNFKLHLSGKMKVSGHINFNGLGLSG